jgi:hypothetical protein
MRSAIQHAQVERQQCQHKQVEKNPEEEHRESYENQVSGVRCQVSGVRKT